MHVCDITTLYSCDIKIYAVVWLLSLLKLILIVPGFASLRISDIRFGRFLLNTLKMVKNDMANIFYIQISKPDMRIYLKIVAMTEVFFFLDKYMYV